jgi:hypothetical protein
MASHLFPLREHGSMAINERGRMIEQYNVTDPSFVVTEKLRLNHYFTRSTAEIQTRIEKGRVSHNETVVENYIERRLKAYSQKTARDETILQFVPELRRRMELVSQL